MNNLVLYQTNTPLLYCCLNLLSTLNPISIIGVIGGLDSAEAVGKVTLRTSTLYSRLQRAPKEFARIRELVDLLQAELKAISSLQADPQSQIPSSIEPAFIAAITATENATNELQSHCDKVFPKKKGLKSNVSWVFKHRDPMIDLEHQLEACRSRLSMLLHIISLLVLINKSYHWCANAEKKNP